MAAARRAAGRRACAPILAAPKCCAAKSFRLTPKVFRSRARPGATCPCAKKTASGRLNFRWPRSATSKPRPICLIRKAGNTGPKVRTPEFPFTPTRIARRTRFTAPSRACSARPKIAVTTQNESLEKQIQQIEQLGHTIIPPSGKLRDLIQCLPHIIGTLGCRILHLLPVNPTPTTYARFGRFGSPYAAQDLTAIDPALVVFDKRTTGIDQFRELTFATHQARRARLPRHRHQPHRLGFDACRKIIPNGFCEIPTARSPAPARGERPGKIWSNSSMKASRSGMNWSKCF